MKLYNYDHNCNYLEIGVHYGETFSKIQCSNKDGVDTEDYCASQYVNYKMTSDEFFKNHIKKQYDVIFIDGLHTAYQVTQDLYNSIKNLKDDGGVIIIDDMYPISEMEQRALDLTISGRNTGDVWKAVYDVLPQLECVAHIFFIKYPPHVGSGVLAIKFKNNSQNIVIDPSIPSMNTGWYKGPEKVWTKYTYETDFPVYLEKLNKYHINL